MFTYLFKGLLSAAALKLLDSYRHLSIRLLKIETAKSYLHGVRMARLSALSMMWVGLEIGLLCIGVVLFHVGFFVLLPWTVKAKAAMGMFLGLAYMILGGAALRMALSERTWMEKSGASQLLKDATVEHPDNS
jgi:hypothetical protein